MKLTRLKLFVVATVFMASAISSQAVILDGKEWRQVTDSTGISWLQLNAIYDADTGLLDTGNSTITTSMRTIDFTGWKWASSNEVSAMFEAAGIPCNNARPCDVSAIDDVWAPTFIKITGSEQDQGYFNETNKGTLSYEVFGWTRSFDQQYASVASVRDGLGQYGDLAMEQTYTQSATTNYLGAWLYRDAAATVPTPPTFLLVVLGLAMSRSLHSCHQKKRSISLKSEH